MKAKTILIPSEALAISESEVKNLLKHNYEILPVEKISNFIDDQNEQYSYLKIIFSQNIPNFAMGVLDIQSGKIIDEIPLMMTSFGNAFSFTVKESIGKREIGALNKLIDYKIKKFVE